MHLCIYFAQFETMLCTPASMCFWFVMTQNSYLFTDFGPLLLAKCLTVHSKSLVPFRIVIQSHYIDFSGNSRLTGLTLRKLHLNVSYVSSYCCSHQYVFFCNDRLQFKPIKYLFISKPTLCFISTRMTSLKNVMKEQRMTLKLFQKVVFVSLLKQG